MNGERPPQRPYFLRACHAWIGDCGLTPQIIVDADAPGVEVPSGYAQDGRMVLNVSARATEGLVIGNETLEFRARFGAAVSRVRVPIAAVLGIYARETGEGLAFAAETPPRGGAEPEAPGGRPQLKIVK